MKKIVVFRVDGNETIGIGHVMRCLSIAEIFRSKGYQILFIVADYSSECLITKRKYEIEVLNSDYTDLEAELSEWEGLSIWKSKYDNALIIVDSYYVTDVYFNDLRRKIYSGFSNNFKMVYIDDLGSAYSNIDIIINYNLYGSDIDYLSLYSGKPPILILGSEYVPLRNEFRGLPNKKQKKEITRILFSTGGTDPYNLIINIINDIFANNKTNSNRTTEYHFLIGSMIKDRRDIYNLSKGHNSIVLHESVMDMKTLISSMDICVSASGSTLYEICACGVPLISYVMADNQLFGARAFEREGLSYYIGDIRTMDAPVSVIMSAIDFLSDSLDIRISMGERMQKQIDGNGANRLVDTIIMSMK